MTALRNIFDDLVDKKLWPIAVLLVAALVALPLAFGAGGGGDDQAAAPEPASPAATAAAAAAAPAAQQVSLEPDPALDKRSRKGKVRDPFKQLVEPAKAATGDSAATAPGPTTAPGPAGPAGGPLRSPTAIGSPDPPAGLPSSPKLDSTPSVPKVDIAPKADQQPARSDDDDRADVVFRFAERGKDARRFDDPVKLAGVPNARYPLLAYAGVRSDGKALRFVVNPLVRVTGDGRCRPSRTACRTLEARPGGTVLVDVLESPTKVAHYRLDVVRASR